MPDVPERELTARDEKPSRHCQIVRERVNPSHAPPFMSVASRPRG